jgi:hypothetical protein
VWKPSKKSEAEFDKKLREKEFAKLVEKVRKEHEDEA